MSVVQNDDAPAAGFDRWNEVDYNSIDYGYLSQMPNESEVGPGGGFYITTAINYANGPAHMGHAYEGVTADVIARYHRLLGDKPAFFVTGADEHGQKIAQTAEDANETPIDICNRFVTGFKVLNQRTLVSYDDYVRTTSDRHKRTAQELWKRCNESGDIYLDTYSGWYNVREETFVTEYDAKLSDYKDPSSGKPLKRVEEESYFFKMSKYQEQLIEHIETHLEFIQPTQHRNYILQRLRTDELRNLSISRNTFSWGIKVPSGFDESHVMYVWVDALTNYLTGVDRLGQNGGTVRAGLQNLWPADVHIIGKDILWFHTVIWPCLLMSADLPLAKTVFAHGFVNDGEGKKMSKSLGNVIDPHDMLDKFHVDTFRWYLCKESPYGGDLSFSEESMRDMHNADLCDTLGNLLHRITNLTHKYCAGVIPDVQAEGVLDYGSIIGQYNTKMQSYELQGGANVVMHALRDLNAYLQESAPWRLKGEANSSKRQTIVRTALESCYVLGHLLLPFIPNGGRTLFLKLGKKPVALCDLKTDGNNLTVGDAVSIGDVMYTKSLPPGAADSSNVVRETYEEAQKRKKEAKAKAQASSKRGQEANADQCDFTKMDVRILIPHLLYPTHHFSHRFVSGK